VQALVWPVLQLPPVEGLVEGLVVEAAAVREGEGDPEVERQVVPQGVLPDVHQAVPGAQARQVDHRVVPRPEALLRPVADLAVHLEPAKSSDSLDRMGYLLSPTTLARVLVLAFWEDFAEVGSLDPLLVGTAEGAVATMGRPPVEAIPWTRWSQLWRRGKSWEPLVVELPSGSRFVGLAGG
jgi:hypothetical protein